MKERFKNEPPYDRPAYAPQTMAERLIDCAVLTDKLDALLELPLDLDSEDTAEVTTTPVGDQTLTRMFRYIDTDITPGEQSQATVEKRIKIRYTVENTRPIERYYIALYTRISHPHIGHESFTTLYFIDYFNNKRDVRSAITEQDVDAFSHSKMTDRSALHYDHLQLFDELERLQIALARR